MGKMQIGRWGNSLAVRLPRDLAERYSLAVGDEIESSAIEAALETLNADTVRARRRQAIREMAEMNWTLPPDWSFDREEANAR